MCRSFVGRHALDTYITGICVMGLPCYTISHRGRRTWDGYRGRIPRQRAIGRSIPACLIPVPSGLEHVESSCSLRRSEVSRFALPSLPFPYPETAHVPTDSTVTACQSTAACCRWCTPCLSLWCINMYGIYECRKMVPGRWTGFRACWCSCDS